MSGIVIFLSFALMQRKRKICIIFFMIACVIHPLTISLRRSIRKRTGLFIMFFTSRRRYGRVKIKRHFQGKFLPRLHEWTGACCLIKGRGRLSYRMELSGIEFLEDRCNDSCIYTYVKSHSHSCRVSGCVTGGQNDKTVQAAAFQIPEEEIWND